MNLTIAYILCAAFLPAAAENLPDRAQITALSKSFLRDSTELPMDVVVKTVVTDAKGKTKRNAEAKVRFLFKGFSGGTESYSFRSTAGFTGLKILYDSFGPNFSAIDAFTRLGPKAPDLVIEPAGVPGAFVVRSKPAPECHGFTMASNILYPRNYCYSTMFHVSRDAESDLAIRDFQIEIEQLPAPGKVRYLGDSQVRKIHGEGTVQQAHFGSDPRAFLIPKHITVTVETDKGTVVVTSDYKLR